ncbi:hypothetical protein QCN29_34340 [Streptomyces sp. HNM0663]|uniref:Uncharacterized protein n=1 Tax=Streptomyces chengmaiensis TaxID=3040919 RepID=A0ABT6I0M7_9ACTN|nr:hypothetical protein [Streptomyces chengmaiensis]MDH2393754.1 hypothetical protein [Streptomyces chengmaiensis]
MSTKSKPGDGTHAKGSKGLPFGEAKRTPVAVVRDVIRSLAASVLR